MLAKKSLEEIRHQIDGTDSDILALLNKRARLAAEVAEVKKASDGETWFYRPEREAQVLQRVIALNEGPLLGEEVARLFREVMSACLALEMPMKVAYLGPEGTFTQVAALKHFGHSVTTLAVNSIAEIFRDVDAGACHYGVVPIENSIEGVVNHTLDLLIDSNLKICGEVDLRIHHYLMAKENGLDNIKAVYGHQHALAQCRSWLDEFLPDVERIATSSNAAGAQRVQNEVNTASIGSETSVELYGLQILAQNIEDEPDNTTRFLVLGKRDTLPSGNDKTSILFTTANKPGALHEMLSCFAANNISLTRIESRPSRAGLWDYVFFADFEGHVEQEHIAETLKKLETTASIVKVLGSYPKAVL